MKTRSELFFPPAANNHRKELPLDFANKTIDALIAYNKSLMTRFLSVKEISEETLSQELLEINLAMYIELYEIPPISKSFKGDTAFLKKELIIRVIAEIKRYEQIKLQIGKGDLDYSYLSCFITHNIAMNELLENTKKERVKLLLSLFFSKEYARKKSKEIVLNVTNKKSPLMVEYNALADILNSLKPQCSAICLQFLENIEINRIKVQIPGELVERTVTKMGMSKFEHNRLLKKEKRLQALDWPNEALQNLIKEFIDYKTKINSNLTSTVHDNFLALYGRMSDLYRVEAQIDELIRAQKNKVDALEQEKKVVQAIESEKEKPLQELKGPEQELKMETAPLVTFAEEILAAQTVNDFAKEPFSVIEPVLAEPVIDSGEQGELEDKQAQEEPIYIYKPYYKKAEKQIQCAQQNILNLKEDDRKTYLQVFAEPLCASINLRALVNLTLSFGGTIKTTGSNRCRIEIQNIYAFVAVPQEALEKPCNSATITMHGGGHRSKPSQNHDRENAPGYLIEQFKDAFVRAGLTPKNLGLELDSANSPLCPK